MNRSLTKLTIGIILWLVSVWFVFHMARPQAGNTLFPELEPRYAYEHFSEESVYLPARFLSGSVSYGLKDIPWSEGVWQEALALLELDNFSVQSYMIHSTFAEALSREALAQLWYGLSTLSWGEEESGLLMAVAYRMGRHYGEEGFREVFQADIPITPKLNALLGLGARNPEHMFALAMDETFRAELESWVPLFAEFTAARNPQETLKVLADLIYSSVPNEEDPYQTEHRYLRSALWRALEVSGDHVLVESIWDPIMASVDPASKHTLLRNWIRNSPDLNPDTFFSLYKKLPESMKGNGSTMFTQELALRSPMDFLNMERPDFIDDHIWNASRLNSMMEVADADYSVAMDLILNEPVSESKDRFIQQMILYDDYLDGGMALQLASDIKNVRLREITVIEVARRLMFEDPSQARALINYHPAISPAVTQQLRTELDDAEWIGLLESHKDRLAGE